MKRIKTTKVEKDKVLTDDWRFAYQDVKSFFDAMAKRKLLKKATFSVVYHPLLLLAQTYNVKIGRCSSTHITLNADHILLLSYLMGYVKDGCGSESFWGSNKTIATDLGVCSRTIQRRLKDLEIVGFIETTLEHNCERHVYINFTNILTEVYEKADDKFDRDDTMRACGLAVVRFAENNWLEVAKGQQYIQLLYNRCLLKLAKENISDMMRYVFEELCSLQDIEWKIVEEEYKSAKQRYIEIVNEKNRKLLAGTVEVTMED